MALRVPARTRSSTSTTGSGTYTLSEPGQAGWRNFTQAVTENDLANGDQVLYCVVDTTTNPVVQEIGLGTYNNSTKTLTRDTVYQPNGSAVSWGAGTRDVFVIDPVMLAVLTLGNQTITGEKQFSNVARFVLGGTPFSPDAATPLVAQRSGTAGDSCRLAVISGVTGVSEVGLGDTGGQFRGRIYYDNNTEILSLYTAGGERVRLDASGGLRTAADVKYDAFPSGGRLLWGTNSIPSGWSIVASLADKIILTTSTASEIDDTGGSWTISGVTIGSTTLTTANVPSMSIVGGGANDSPGTFVREDTGVFGGSTYRTVVRKASSDGTITAFGSSGSHNHSFSNNAAWRPSYYKAGWIQKS